MATQKSKPGHVLDYAPTADVTVGSIVQFRGKAHLAITDVTAGQKGAFLSSGTVKLDTALTTTDAELEAGAVDVGWNATTGMAVAGGTGDYDIGEVAEAADNGTVLVLLNGQPGGYQYP